MTIWREHLPVAELFNCVVFAYNPFSGQIIAPDWVAIDVLLKRLHIEPTAEQFSNWRIALTSYIEAVNEFSTEQ